MLEPTRHDPTPRRQVVDATTFLRAHRALGEVSQLLDVASSDLQTRLRDLQSLLARAVADAERGGDNAGVPPEPTPADEADRPARSAGERSLPALSILCFGRFEVRRDHCPVALCHNRNGQAVLRYLVAQPRHRATMDALMEALWPDDTPEAARHKLHVASSALRRALNAGYVARKEAGYLLCEDGAYALNPAVGLRVDAEEFLSAYRAGRRAERDGCSPVGHYEAACRLYTGPFLVEDLYADWAVVRREQLTQAHLKMCAALAAHELHAGRYDLAAEWAAIILDENACDEAAYRQLILAHAAAGRRGVAVQQFRRCERVLKEELGVPPMAETKAVFDVVRRGESVAALLEADGVASGGVRAGVR